MTPEQNRHASYQNSPRHGMINRVQDRIEVAESFFGVPPQTTTFEEAREENLK